MLAAKNRFEWHLSNSTRGMFFMVEVDGSPYNNIDFVTIHQQVMLTDFGDLTVKDNASRWCRKQTRGLCWVEIIP